MVAKHETRYQEEGKMGDNMNTIPTSHKRLAIWTVLIAGILGITTNAEAYLHPQTGRFVQRDPKDSDKAGGGYHDGMNLYEYVGSEPISHVDTWGLSGVTTTTQPSLDPLDVKIRFRSVNSTKDVGPWISWWAENRDYDPGPLHAKVEAKDIKKYQNGKGIVGYYGTWGHVFAYDFHAGNKCTEVIQTVTNKYSLWFPAKVLTTTRPAKARASAIKLPGQHPLWDIQLYDKSFVVESFLIGKTPRYAPDDHHIFNHDVSKKGMGVEMTQEIVFCCGSCTIKPEKTHEKRGFIMYARLQGYKYKSVKLYESAARTAASKVKCIGPKHRFMMRYRYLPGTPTIFEVREMQ
jgi:RHS repeat-associated protein